VVVSSYYNLYKLYNLYELVHDGGECLSNDAQLLNSDSVEECAAHCAAADGCEFFSYRPNNQCYHEFTTSRDCPEGFDTDDFDFYALVRGVPSPPPALPSPPAPPPQAFELVHEGGACGSSNSNLPTADSVEECAAHCGAKAGCEFFVYSTNGNKYCLHEETASRDCPEGFVSHSYNFYALVDSSCPPPPAPSPPPLPSAGYVLVQEQKECDDDGETDHGYYLTLQECADECAATTGCVNFIYARIGAGRCSGTNCKCYTVRARLPVCRPSSFSRTPPEP